MRWLKARLNVHTMNHTGTPEPFLRSQITFSVTGTVTFYPKLR